MWFRKERLGRWVRMISLLHSKAPSCEVARLKNYDTFHFTSTNNVTVPHTSSSIRGDRNLATLSSLAPNLLQCFTASSVSTPTATKPTAHTHIGMPMRLFAYHSPQRMPTSSAQPRNSQSSFAKSPSCRTVSYTLLTLQDSLQPPINLESCGHQSDLTCICSYPPCPLSWVKATQPTISCYDSGTVMCSMRKGWPTRSGLPAICCYPPRGAATVSFRTFGK